MSEHLDAIFGSIRGFAQKLAASQQYLVRAEETKDRAWRLTFLREARRAYEGALPHLLKLRASLEETPMAELRDQVVAIETSFVSHEQRLLKLETQLAFAAGPAGTA